MQRGLVAAALIAAIFALDTFTVLGSAIAVLYVLPLLLIGSGSRSGAIFPWSGVCAALTLVSFFWNHVPEPGLSPVARMVVSLAANAVTTLLILRVRHAFATLRASATRHREVVDKLAIGLWENDFSPVEQALAALRATGVADLRRHIAAHPQFVAEMRRLVRIANVNETALRLLEVPSRRMFFPRLGDLMPENEASFGELLLALDERRPFFQTEARVHTRSGGMLDVIIAIGIPADGPLDRVTASILDVSERNRLATTVEKMRAQLDRAQRATILAQMSAAIAHEINQPLSAVRSYAEACSRWLDRPQPDLAEAQDALQMVVKAVDHVHAVIGSVRELTGSARHEFTGLAPDDLVAGMEPLLQRDAAEHCGRVSFRLGASNATIRGDAILIQQVIVNLVTNSFQAMAETDACDRVVTIASGIKGDQLLLSVSDRGTGWSEAALDQLLEPFQTTKIDGMGLGLAICRSAIDKHGGTLTMRNLPGGGAVAEIRLPLVEAAHGSIPESSCPGSEAVGHSPQLRTPTSSGALQSRNGPMDPKHLLASSMVPHPSTAGGSAAFQWIRS